MKLASPPVLHTTERKAFGSEHASSFAALYEEHRQRLLVYCMTRTHDPTVAEDIVQEVFVKAYGRLADFDPSRPFWPWLLAIAKRKCVDVHRRKSYAMSRTGELTDVPSTDLEDPTASLVVDRIESRRLQRALAGLPPRQRVALQLFALDGWTYTEIADQLGCTVATIKQLMTRARARLREAGARALAALGAATNALRARVQQLLGRLPEFLATPPEAVPNWTQAVVGVAAASVLMAGVGLVTVRPPNDSAPHHQAQPVAARVVAPPLARTSAEAQAPTNGRVAGTAPPLHAVQHDVEQTANQALAPVLGPSASGDGGQPETTSFVLSPNYDEDHTVFASTANSQWSSLWVSPDGGASWRRLQAQGLGYDARLLLPPSFPHDNRMFAVTGRGLQASRDGGSTFDTVAPLPTLWSNAYAALSPAFDHGHPAVLFTAHGLVYEYRDDVRTVRPLLLQAAGGVDVRVDSAQYSTSYPRDPTIFVTTSDARAIGTWPAVHRCRVLEVTPALHEAPRRDLHLQCDQGTMLPDNLTFAVSLPPTPVDGLATGFAVAGSGVYASDDGGRTFRQTARRKLGVFSGLVRDIAIGRWSGGSTAVVAQSRWGGAEIPPLERTDDGGITWTPLFVDLPEFADGASAVVVTPTGRILAGAIGGGTACSDDNGRTWAPTCAGPDA